MLNFPNGFYEAQNFRFYAEFVQHVVHDLTVRVVNLCRIVTDVYVGHGTSYLVSESKAYRLYGYVKFGSDRSPCMACPVGGYVRANREEGLLPSPSAASERPYLS